MINEEQKAALAIAHVVDKSVIPELFYISVLMEDHDSMIYIVENYLDSFSNDELERVTSLKSLASHAAENEELMYCQNTLH